MLAKRIRTMRVVISVLMISAAANAALGEGLSREQQEGLWDKHIRGKRPDTIVDNWAGIAGMPLFQADQGNSACAAVMASVLADSFGNPPLSVDFEKPCQMYGDAFQAEVKRIYGAGSLMSKEKQKELHGLVRFDAAQTKAQEARSRLTKRGDLPKTAGGWKVALAEVYLDGQASAESLAKALREYALDHRLNVQVEETREIRFASVCEAVHRRAPVVLRDKQTQALLICVAYLEIGQQKFVCLADVTKVQYRLVPALEGRPKIDMVSNDPAVVAMRNAHKDMRLKKDSAVEFSEPLGAALEIREFAVSDYDYMILCSSWEGYVDGKTVDQMEAILLGPAQPEQP